MLHLFFPYMFSFSFHHVDTNFLKLFVLCLEQHQKQGFRRDDASILPFYSEKLVRDFIELPTKDDHIK